MSNPLVALIRFETEAWRIVNFLQRNLYPSARSTNFGSAAIATSEPLAASAGLAILQRGGSAVDAAIAAAAVLTVTEPVSNGLGSDAFALVWDGARVRGLNASGRAPRAWTRERFAGRDMMPRRGADAVTVPGAVSAWRTLHEEFGRCAFADLMAPAIRIAREGFGVGPVTAASWARQADELRGQPGFAEAFLHEGKPPAAGERFRFPAAAVALQRIADTKGQDFYEGSIADAIVTALNAAGGVMTKADLESHTADWVEPVHQDFRDVRVHEIPPNGQGIAALMALGIMDRLDLGNDPDSVRTLHLTIEAVKLALADLYAHVADPGTMRINPDSLLDPSYLDARARCVDETRARNATTGKPLGGGTVTLAAADADGMMVSFIQSNYEGFGSGIVEPRFGISLQNRGAAFSLERESPNAVGPSKRPFHTIIPGFVTRGDAPFMAFGVMGGPIQAQGHAQLLSRVVRFGQSVQTAIDAPRFRVLDGNHVAIEPHLPRDTLEGLAVLGHHIATAAPGVAFGFGGAQAVVRWGDLYAAGSDPRKDGMALVM